MKLAAAAVLLLQSMATGSSTPEGAVLAERAHSRDVVKRAGRDCGTFTMACEGAGNACNNACFHINCQPGGQASTTMVQAFHDPQDNRLGDTTINCDEWPMATTRQADFVPGQVRNSLRCIDQTENSYAGGQLAAFIRGDLPARGQRKTCAGTVVTGDFWQVKFDLTGADPSKTRYCTQTGGCANDQYQFHMTSKASAIDFPYNPSTMNRYTQEGTGGKDLLQCSVTVHRVGDMAFNIAVYDNTGAKRGEKALSAFANTASIDVPGLPHILTFKKNGPLVASGAANLFVYRSPFPVSWGGDTQGSSPYNPTNGKWCSVTNSGTGTQDLLCYFPCPAA
ncbi:MAG: hypothetical protein LQ346_006569 [Caloplaca aetnensis]|nr:MAG: hypothetical protein LQ346_006569 [Caloplaca aetnensis]